jgi:hypothetical protein
MIYLEAEIVLNKHQQINCVVYFYAKPILDKQMLLSFFIFLVKLKLFDIPRYKTMAGLQRLFSKHSPNRGSALVSSVRIKQLYLGRLKKNTIVVSDPS